MMVTINITILHPVKIPDHSKIKDGDWFLQIHHFLLDHKKRKQQNTNVPAPSSSRKFSRSKKRSLFFRVKA